MATWSIAPLHIEDLDEFVQCQFLAFVGNPLHDVVYPTQPASAEKHRKAINEGSKLQADNEIIYLKAVDIRSGNIVGGIKCCYYVGEDVLTSSPYAAGITDVEAKATDNDQYCCYVVNEFLGKRASDIKGQHARKFIAKDRKHGWSGRSNAWQSSISSLYIPNTAGEASAESLSPAHVQWRTGEG